ncbi:MAG: hypothetical protein ACLSAC_15670 [Enterocloster bolteae]
MEGYGITRGRLSRYRLFWTKNIYDRQGAEQMFFSAVRENCAYHYRHCREYRKILRRSGFRPGHLESSRDIGRIPVLPTLFFKHHAIYSIAPECTWLKTTSSGTSGTASQVNFDGGALLCGLGMVARTVSKGDYCPSDRPVTLYSAMNPTEITARRLPEVFSGPLFSHRLSAGIMP